MSNKKKEQLGMNPSTASGRLVKDIVWDYIVKCGDNKCFQCGEEMTRENFSIEHKVPWLDSENPIDLFFDLNNIAFSHLSCNRKAARTVKPKEFNNISCGTSTKYRRGCRCDSCKESHKIRQANWRKSKD